MTNFEQKGMTFGQRIKSLRYMLYPRKPILTPGLVAHIAQSRFYIYFLMWARFFYFIIRQKGRVAKYSTGNDHWLSYAIFHNSEENYAQMMFNRGRMEQLLYPLLSIPPLRKNAAKLKMLCIGPRNEGELLLFSKFGFKWDNITGADLFSYSPKIVVADAHDLKFPDNSFDVVVSSWMLVYCADVPKVISEMIRVAKNGAYIAVGFSSTSPERTFNVATRIGGGVDQVLGYFGNHVDEVFWRLNDTKPDNTDHSLIFKLKK